MQISLAEAVYRIIRERREAIQDLLFYDNVSSMEQYRELMGNLKALDHVEQELKSLLDKQEQTDEMKALKLTFLAQQPPLRK